MMGSTSIMRQLLDNINQQWKGPDGLTFVHRAVAHCQYDALKFLYTAGLCTPVSRENLLQMALQMSTKLADDNLRKLLRPNESPASMNEIIEFLGTFGWSLPGPYQTAVIASTTSFQSASRFSMPYIVAIVRADCLWALKKYVEQDSTLLLCSLDRSNQNDNILDLRHYAELYEAKTIIKWLVSEHTLPPPNQNQLNHRLLHSVHQWNFAAAYQAILDGADLMQEDNGRSIGVYLFEEACTKNGRIGTANEHMVNKIAEYIEYEPSASDAVRAASSETDEMYYWIINKLISLRKDLQYDDKQRTLIGHHMQRSRSDNADELILIKLLANDAIPQLSTRSQDNSLAESVIEKGWTTALQYLARLYSWGTLYRGSKNSLLELAMKNSGSKSSIGVLEVEEKTVLDVLQTKIFKLQAIDDDRVALLDLKQDGSSLGRLIESSCYKNALDLVGVGGQSLLARRMRFGELRRRPLIWGLVTSDLRPLPLIVKLIDETSSIMEMGIKARVNGVNLIDELTAYPAMDSKILIFLLDEYVEMDKKIGDSEDDSADGGDHISYLELHKREIDLIAEPTVLSRIIDTDKLTPDLVQYLWTDKARLNPSMHQKLVGFNDLEECFQHAMISQHLKGVTTLFELLTPDRQKLVRDEALMQTLCSRTEITSPDSLASYFLQHGAGQCFEEDKGLLHEALFLSVVHNCPSFLKKYGHYGLDLTFNLSLHGRRSKFYMELSASVYATEQLPLLAWAVLASPYSRASKDLLDFLLRSGQDIEYQLPDGKFLLDACLNKLAQLPMISALLSRGAPLIVQTGQKSIAARILQEYKLILCSRAVANRRGLELAGLGEKIDSYYVPSWWTDERITDWQWATNNLESSMT